MRAVRQQEIHDARIAAPRRLVSEPIRLDRERFHLGAARHQKRRQRCYSPDRPPGEAAASPEVVPRP